MRQVCKWSKCNPKKNIYYDNQISNFDAIAELELVNFFWLILNFHIFIDLFYN